MRDLVVGDLHCQIKNLEDTEIVFHKIAEVFKQYDCSKIIFLGDGFHQHSVLRQEVVDLIKTQLKLLSKECGLLFSDIKFIVGNHDGVSPICIKPNACRLVLSELVHVIDEVTVEGNRVYAPFMANNQEFVSAVNAAKPSEDAVLFCHQSFNSAVYDSGFPVKDGVNLEEVQYGQIIAGHIHKTQALGNKVLYLGSVRAISADEHDQNKGLWIIDSENKEAPRFVTLNPFVKCYHRLEIVEGKDEDLFLINRPEIAAWKTDKDDCRVYVCGTEEFYKKVLQINKQYESLVKFIPVLKKDLGKLISLDQSKANLDSALHKYVHEIALIPQNLREEVWTNVKTLMQK